MLGYLSLVLLAILQRDQMALFRPEDGFFCSLAKG